MLQKQGFNADVTSNGLETIQSLKDKFYHPVFMDVSMPKMDGLQATKHICARSSGMKNHDVPIIGLTDHAMKGDRDKCLSAGMDDYFSKPIIPTDLNSALNKWLIQ